MQRIRGPFRVIPLTAFALALAVAPARLARADFFLHSWQEQHEAAHDLRFDVTAGYYLTKNDFDGQGSLVIPTNFQQYARMQMDALAAYGLTSRLTAFARLGWARTVLNQTAGSSSNMSLTDGTGGLSFRLFDFSAPAKPDGITIDLQAQVDFPPYSNTNLVGPAQGDGTTDFTGGAFANFPIGHLGGSLLTVTAGGGFTYRTASYSSALPWSVSGRVEPRLDGFRFGAGVYGEQSLSNDPRAATLVASGATTPAASTTLSAAAGGSFISGAVNPSVLTVRGEVGYQFGRDLALTGFFAQSAWGQDAPNGMYFGAVLTLRVGGLGGGPSTPGAPRETRRAREEDSTRLSPQDYGRSNQGFVNYSLEARVTRVNDRLNLVKIDKGLQDGVATDQIFDVFLVKKDGNVGAAVARGHVTATQAGESALTIDEYYKEVWIDEGFLAKRPVQ